MKMSFPVAVQVYSVRDDAKADLRGTFDKIKKMGYDGVEFAGLYDKPASEIKALCNDVGLVPISAHVPYNDLLKNPVGTLSQYAEIGCKYVAIPHLGNDQRPGSPNFPYVLGFIEVIAKAAKSLGISLLYHNHDFEFIKLGNKYGLDIIYDTIPADLLGTELDTCWVNVGGEDPAAYVRKYSGRAPLLHLKDFWGDRSGAAYELIGVDNKAPARPEGFELRPLGKGVQNMPSILRAAKDAGTKWVIIEQDNPSMGLTPLECIKVSIDYLKTINK